MELISFLEQMAYRMRLSSLKMTTNAGSGHPTSALSAADIIAVLFFYTMRYDPDNFNNPNNDRFILSKGHASPILYAVFKELGTLTEKDLMTYRSFGSALEGHPTMRFAYAEAATGALGIGLSIGAGEALCAKLDKRSYKTFVLMGDGEMAEGAIWEAIQIASYYGLNNLIGIIDCNRLGQSTPTMEALEGDAPERFKLMVESFGWHALIVNGHDVKELMAVMNEAYKVQDKPVMIIAKTKKGYGVDLFEDKEEFHGKALKPDQLKIALEQLKKRFAHVATLRSSYRWKPTIPSDELRDIPCMPNEMKRSAYALHEAVATRKAYGQALAELGNACETVVSLDGEVKNSTYAEIFEKAHPERFFQCFIAEQNMVSMGVGFNRRGKIPFISTFGAFLSRAHDQIRMAAIGQASLRLVGSHAGVSIGQDGPSQMALEDIAMMRAIPDSVVLYPADAVSTWALVQQMAQYDKGISYLRTTRMETPVVYENDESFQIGGCKVLKQSPRDQVCIIGAGVTLFEALKAHDQLLKKGIAVCVIDLYSIKPFDLNTIRTRVHASGGRLITVEDHYLQGGLGESVVAALCNDDIQAICLAVTKLPRSGKPEELLAYEGINAAAIMKAVHQLAA